MSHYHDGQSSKHSDVTVYSHTTPTGTQRSNNNYHSHSLPCNYCQQRETSALSILSRYTGDTLGSVYSFDAYSREGPANSQSPAEFDLAEGIPIQYKQCGFKDQIVDIDNQPNNVAYSIPVDQRLMVHHPIYKPLQRQHEPVSVCQPISNSYSHLNSSTPPYSAATTKSYIYQSTNFDDPLPTPPFYKKTPHQDKEVQKLSVSSTKQLSTTLVTDQFHFDAHSMNSHHKVEFMHLLTFKQKCQKYTRINLFVGYGLTLILELFTSVVFFADLRKEWPTWYATLPISCLLIFTLVVSLIGHVLKRSALHLGYVVVHLITSFLLLILALIYLYGHESLIFQIAPKNDLLNSMKKNPDANLTYFSLDWTSYCRLSLEKWLFVLLIICGALLQWQLIGALLYEWIREKKLKQVANDQTIDSMATHMNKNGCEISLLSKEVESSCVYEQKSLPPNVDIPLTPKTRQLSAIGTLM